MVEVTGVVVGVGVGGPGGTSRYALIRSSRECFHDIAIKNDISKHVHCGDQMHQAPEVANVACCDRRKAAPIRMSLHEPGPHLFELLLQLVCLLQRLHIRIVAEALQAVVFLVFDLLLYIIF